jgi:hypothetical protein
MEMQFELQSVRALPAEAGDFLIWNQAIVHWGSKTSPQARESRVSVALQFRCADLSAAGRPVLEPLRVPPFALRLRLIARQLYRQRHLYDLDPALAEIATQQS